jgi:hypothetical protein
MTAIPLAVREYSQIPTGFSSELREDDRERGMGMTCAPKEDDEEEEDADTGLKPLDFIPTGC